MCCRRWSTVLAAQAQWTVWVVTSPSLACPSARAHRAARLTACLMPQTITRARWTWWRKTKPSYPTAPWFTSNRFVHVHKVFTYLHYIYSLPKWLCLYYLQRAYNSFTSLFKTFSHWSIIVISCIADLRTAKSHAKMKQTVVDCFTCQTDSLFLAGINSLNHGPDLLQFSQRQQDTTNW